MVNFMCPFFWGHGMPDALNVSVKLFLDEVSFSIGKLSNEDCPPQCEWASSKHLKA